MLSSESGSIVTVAIQAQYKQFHGIYKVERPYASLNFCSKLSLTTWNDVDYDPFCAKEPIYGYKIDFVNQPHYCYRDKMSCQSHPKPTLFINLIKKSRNTDTK